jgi:hypothetical protein
MRPVAFTHDGVEYKAFPEQGSYFGVTLWEGRRYLLQVPMNTDGTPATYNGEIDPCEVCNMHEEGDDKLLEVINVEFGTDFRQSNFAGR